MMRTSFSVLSFIAGAAALSAQASDPGTYRPGPVYHAGPVAAAELCESRCSGDAGCKSWNFVKVRPQAALGICELVSAVSTPVPSQTSVSGMNGGTRQSSRVIHAGTNTMRVGTPTSQKPTRRIVREPLPEQINLNATRSNTPQPQRHAPNVTVRIAPDLTPVMVPDQTQPVFRHNLDAGHNTRTAPGTQRSIPQTPQQPVSYQKPPQAAPVKTAPPQRRAPARTRRDAGLFGSLHDDVGTQTTAAAPAPRPAQYVAEDPYPTMAGAPKN